MTFEQFYLLINNNEFIVLDVETTGFKFSSGHRITDLCAYKIRDGVVVDRFSKLVNPCRPIPADVAKLTGITDSMVKWAPKFEDIAAEFRKFIGNDVIVGHNVQFDWDNFLEPSLRQMCYYIAPNKTICTLDLARTFLSNLKSKKLSSVYTYLTGKTPTITHRAEADVVMTVEIFLKFREFALNNKDAILASYKTV